MNLQGMLTTYNVRARAARNPVPCPGSGMGTDMTAVVFTLLFLLVERAAAREWPPPASATRAF